MAIAPCPHAPHETQNNAGKQQSKLTRANPVLNQMPRTPQRRPANHGTTGKQKDRTTRSFIRTSNMDPRPMGSSIAPTPFKQRRLALFLVVPTPRRVQDEAKAGQAVASGKTTDENRHTLSSAALQDILLYRNSDLSYKRHTLARHKGRIAIVTNRGPGCGGRDGVGREWHCRAGHREHGLRAYDTTLTSVLAWLRGRAHATLRSPSEDVRGRTSRVVLTSGGWRQVPR